MLALEVEARKVKKCLLLCWQESNPLIRALLSVRDARADGRIDFFIVQSVEQMSELVHQYEVGINVNAVGYAYEGELRPSSRSSNVVSSHGNLIRVGIVGVAAVTEGAS